MRRLTEVDGLVAADVMHRRLSSLPAGATAGEVREYFAVSASRKLAVVVDEERYVGCIPASAVPPAGETGTAADWARPEPTIHPQAPAHRARDLALADPSQRLPVVDDGGTLVGIVAIDRQRIGVCGT